MSVGKCPNCGGEVQNGKCLYCDTVVNTFAETNAKMLNVVKEVRIAEVDRKKRRDNILLIILICVIFLGMIFFAGLMIAPFIISNVSFSQSDYVDTAEEDNSEKIEIFKEKGRWSSGMYKIGEDIPEGTYLMVVDGRSDELFPTSIHALSDVNGDNSIINDTWSENTRYITLTEPGYIDVSWSILYDTKKNDIENNPYEHSGMFLVGKDIEPGTYQLGFGPYTDDVKQSPHQSRYTIYSDVDAIAPLVKEHGDYNDFAEVKLEEGEYLDLEKCVVIGKKEE